MGSTRQFASSYLQKYVFLQTIKIGWRWLGVKETAEALFSCLRWESFVGVLAPGRF